LYDTTGEKVLLEKEVSYLKNYIELERLRFSGEVTIELIVNADLDRHLIAPFLLLPLVENAFKHGLSKQTKHSWLRIHITLEQSTLTAVFENTKPSSATNAAKGGIGLDNLRKRLQLLYPNKHHLELEDRKDTYIAKLIIEL
jgi:two-component system LytT family sensor kinase